jgi:hypothetical protein
MQFACNCCVRLAVSDCLISRPQDAMSLCLCIRILCEIKVHVFKSVILTSMRFSEETRQLCRFRASVAFVTLFVGTSAFFSHAPYCTFTLIFVSLYGDLNIYIYIYRLCLSPCALFAVNCRFRPATTCFGFSFRRCCLTKASWLQSLQAKVVLAAVMIMPFIVISACLRRATRNTRHPSSSSRTHRTRALQTSCVRLLRCRRASGGCPAAAHAALSPAGGVSLAPCSAYFHAILLNFAAVGRLGWRGKHVR